MRRYPLHEDGDEDGELYAADGPWACEVCGEWERNVDGWDGAACYFCQELRGSWQCPCGLINPDGDSCQECGRVRER